MTGILIFSACGNEEKKIEIYKPVIDGEWWNVTSLPDLGNYTGENQEPVDFGVWQSHASFAADSL